MKYIVQPIIASSANMPSIAAGKIYGIVSVNSGKVLTVRNGQIYLEQRNWNEDTRQQWRIEALSGGDTGYYRIVSINSGKVLDVKGNSQDNGANLIEWSWHGGHNQQFRLVLFSSGNMRIDVRHSGKSLDIRGASRDDGADVIQWPWHGGPNQQWRLATVHDASTIDDFEKRVIVFEHKNYQGRSQVLGVGSFRLSDLPAKFGDNTLSSLRVPDGLRVTLFDNDNFRAGTHNRTWGVNAADQIWTRDGVNGSWQQIPGGLKQISVASNGRVWGVNAADQIYTRDGVNGAWQQIPGALKHVSVNASGRVWGVNAADQIYTRDGVDGEWQQIPGALKQIDVSDSGRVWGVNAADQIWTRDGVNGSWQQIPGGLKQISVASNGRVWSVNANDDIFTRDGVNGEWQQIPGRLKYVSVANSGSVWGVNANDDIFAREGVNGEWQQIPGKLKQIETSSMFAGRSKQFTADSPDVGDFNDLTSSILVEPVVTIYEHDRFQGRSQRLGVGRYNMNALAIGNDTLSSIKVPIGMMATLYEHADFKGRIRTFTEDAEWVGDDFNDITSGIVVKAIGVSIPNGTLKYGDKIAFLTAHNKYLVAAADGGLNANGNSVGSPEQFTVVRAGNTKFQNYVSFGDTIALRSDRNKYVAAEADGNASAKCDAIGGWEQFVIERSGSTLHSSFVTVGDKVSLRSLAHNKYVVAEADGKANANRDGVGSWEQFTVRTEQALSGSGACGAAACSAAIGTSFCGAQAAGAAVCGQELCGADACGAAACGSNQTLIGACGTAATGYAVCGADIAVATVAGVSACAAAVGGLTACGADICGAAACGAETCGAAACGGAACGANVCGGAADVTSACAKEACGAAACVAEACAAEACAAEANVIEACPADACAANTCAINLCPADACAADACAIDVIPIIPGI